MQYCHFDSYGLFYMWNGSENYKRVGVLNSEQASKWKPRVLRDADGSILWSLTWSGDILLLKSTCWILLNALLPCIPWAFSSNLLSLDRFSLSWDQERRIIESIRDWDCWNLVFTTLSKLEIIASEYVRILKLFTNNESTCSEHRHSKAGMWPTTVGALTSHKSWFWVYIVTPKK